MNILIESYVDTRRMIDRVNTAMYKALTGTGIKMPFPTQEVFHEIEAEDISHFVELFRRSE